MSSFLALTLAAALAATPTPTAPPTQREQPPAPGKPADFQLPRKRSWLSIWGWLFAMLRLRSASARTRSKSWAGTAGFFATSATSCTSCGPNSLSTVPPMLVSSGLTLCSRLPPMRAASSASCCAERVVVPSSSIWEVRSASQVCSAVSCTLPVETTSCTSTLGMLP